MTGNLTLFRSRGESFIVFIDGKEVKVKVTGAQNNRARLVVSADESIIIEREERINGG